MKCLLDTHIILWALLDRPDLSAKARHIISAGDNLLLYSTVSLWEVTIKNQLHPRDIPCSGTELLRYCDASVMCNLPVKNHHILALERLYRSNSVPLHKDPFDRLLLAQAMAENAVFLTHDKTLALYENVHVELV
ncbi:MAG: type II toxin-antitoxin system VapC family toxin [Schwartzia sp.]|nr:type II toxin-antitoxin system VapC family toxin [Schwartzia sp. (in: firmicutes)]